MTTGELLSTLRQRGIRLSIDGDRLVCDGPPGALDEALRGALADHRDELVTLIAGVGNPRRGSHSLVPLKPTGDRVPLFARPGHNGDVFCYRALATHVHPDQPLYGVEPQGVDGSSIPATVEEIAAYEVAQIKMLQPRGPYRLAGYCAGGTIVLEAARQLVAAGEEVARLVLFGSPFPTVYRDHGLRLYLQSRAYRVRHHTAAATTGSVADGVGYVRERLRARTADAAKRDDPSRANRRRLEEATMAAVERYDPSPYPGRLDLIFPSETWRHSGDRPDAWRGVAAEVVEHIGPDGSDGDDMLREPHVRDVAALVTQALGDEGGQDAAD